VTARAAADPRAPALSGVGAADRAEWADPAYIRQMHDVFARAARSATGLAYETYFDGGTDYDCVFSIHDKACGFDRHKADADLYRTLWSKTYATS